MGHIQTKYLKMKSGKDFIIRTAEIEDAQPLIDFANNLETAYEFRLSEKDELNLTLENEIEFIRKLKEGSDNLGLIVECENQIIGFLDFHKKTKRRLSHIGEFGISIHKDFVNQGIGTAMLETLFEWAREIPTIQKIVLGVLDGNLPAISLYEKMGFIEEGRLIKEIKLSDGTLIDNIRMYKWVK